MAKDLLEGKPIGHPLHPLLVHMPIGLFFLSLLFDLFDRLGVPSEAWVRSAFATMALGIILALVAAVPGFVDWSDIRADNPAKKTGLYHMLLNLVVVALYIANLLWRRNHLSEVQTATGPFVLSIVAMIILGISGYLGGTLVYDDGIAVGRHRRETPTPTDTIRAHSADGRGGWVAVGETDRLQEQSSWRAEVNGYVMAIVKLHGQVYAFQDFCTHRFGPLSEGTFRGGQVMCPWHGSCFDVRSGRVTEGPAKVELKTYPVRVQDGVISINVPEKAPAPAPR